jgi:hypothetical protein
MRKNFHYAETKAQKQAAWLASFNDAVVTAAPENAGRIRWEEAKHFYFTGLSVPEAVAKYLSIEGEQA